MKETFWTKNISEAISIHARETEQGILLIFETKNPTCIKIEPDGKVLAHFKKETAEELCDLIDHVLENGNPKDEQ